MDQGEVPTHVVQKWLNDVQRVLDDTHLTEEKGKTAKRCLNGLLPVCRSNLSLGQCISELIMEGTKLTRTEWDRAYASEAGHVRIAWSRVR
ncbi:hypothetical protein FRX31_016374 [Thalictrum thalictroides]|uniref:Uncharacterized protein n=1 Tax=Thalictrum thalictroides TaxID=46969 RepID=A0A7J6W9D3_THATH|nr:hypothetical protein FRX31_016374 [Thalictrum thalictroides]